MSAPFALVHAEVLQDRRLTLTQTRVLIALRMSFNPKKPHEPVFPSLAVLAERTGHGQKQISAATAKLAEYGWLRKVSGVGHQATRYFLDTPSVAGGESLESGRGVLLSGEGSPPTAGAESPESGSPYRADHEQTNEQTNKHIVSASPRLPVQVEILADPVVEVVTSRRRRESWISPFAEVWSEKVGVPNFGRLGKALRPLVEAHPVEEVLPIWGEYLAGEAPRFVSAERFAQQYRALSSGEYWSITGKTEDPIATQHRRISERAAAERARTQRPQLPELSEPDEPGEREEESWG